MAGHSKWSKIKRAKGANDAKKGAVLAKMAKVIMIAVKSGGSDDPKLNFQLRTAIEKAKAAGVPKANIERAIEKASGSNSSDEVKEVTYEGYLPGGVAVMVFTATDNVNRTYGDLRTIFSKSDGSLGSPGCVAYMFNKQGQLIIQKPDEAHGSWDTEAEEELLAIALEAGAEDMDTSDDEDLVIVIDPENFEAVSEKIKSALELINEATKIEQKKDDDLLKYRIKETKLALVPEITVEVSNQKDLDNIYKAMEALDDNDDVIDLVSNF